MPTWLITILIEFLPTLIKEGENLFSSHKKEDVAKVVQTAATIVAQGAEALAGGQTSSSDSSVSGAVGSLHMPG